MDLSLTLSPLVGLVMLCVTGGAFGAVATAVASRFGRARLVPLWIGTSVTLGSLAAIRLLLIQRSLGLSADRINRPGLFALLVTAMAVLLSVPTFEVWRRASPSISINYARRVAAAAAWTVFGGVLMVLVAVVLDLANVPFVPIR
jgi:drug/metabolite transporter (DMT)-like permease